MADVMNLAPIILKWEGGYENDPDDKGNYDMNHMLIGSNKGITPAAYHQAFNVWPSIDQMKTIGLPQFSIVLKKLYWDRYAADQISNQSIANILVDWVWGSGTPGITKVQTMLGLLPDGQVGPKTILAINNTDQSQLFQRVKTLRLQFVNDIVADHPNQMKWLHGWVNRINSYTFHP